MNNTLRQGGRHMRNGERTLGRLVPRLASTVSPNCVASDCFQEVVCVALVRSIPVRVQRVVNNDEQCHI
jgi:hypothetical protein